MTPEQLACGFAEQHPLPAWYSITTERITDRHDAAPYLERVVHASPNLTTRLLALVNSSLYGFPSPILMLPMATTVLGPRALLDLLRVLATAEALKAVQPCTLDCETFWQHAVLTGLLTQHLGRKRGLRNSETLFLAGLLHDVGKLVFHEKLPDHAALLRRQYTSAQDREFQLEHRLLGFDHAATGAALLKTWSLPDVLVSAARNHHRQTQPESHVSIACLVAEADRYWRSPGLTPSTSGKVPHAIETPQRTELELQAVQLHELLFGTHNRFISDMMSS